ncbi:MAG: ABC transporter ATP-binding protein [Candidatus Colwellbacteria bacterium CG_4_9_14_0_2_um_filter_50_12]|uniref:ABC transporter ATP-binding protein n=1 Tax=Candidatus Colwellbacteria bacterium CG_4_9_14_0_2_um_filter_50_12 TaxID=1974538 RepID=A0A2M8G106_9BACT|nr:MAG: ABC transporter ATP-binding protein [Candidatus Colwellbacteria bacterium CG_4_9_14_0_2_um_filter_50_12]
MKILEVRDLSVYFDNTAALENVSFDVEREDSLAIIGPNGAGKTVLFRALLGTVPYQGEIKWAGDARIGYVPQRLTIERALPLTVQEFLNTKLHILRANPSEVKSLLEIVRLQPAILKRPLAKISSGQLQRALIVFALIGNPNVLLFDEPTASVDPSSEEQIYETLHNLEDQRHLTTLIISHDLSLVYRYANKVLCLSGKQLCFGVPQETLSTETLNKLYGAPRKYYEHHHEHGHNHVHN